MSLREGLLKVLNDYLDIKKQPFKKENYEPIFHTLITDIKNNFAGKNYSIKSHPGQGIWSSVPWIEISRRKDIYVTYLKEIAQVYIYPYNKKLMVFLKAN